MIAINKKTGAILYSPTLVHDDVEKFFFDDGFIVRSEDGLLEIDEEDGWEELKEKRGRVLDAFDKYLSTATKEKLEKDWQELKHFNEQGQDVEEFIKNQEETATSINTLDKLVSTLEEIKQINSKNHEVFMNEFRNFVNESCTYLERIKNNTESL